MTAQGAIKAVGYLSGAALFGVGAWFLLSPETALTATSHAAPQLPYVMGGRYIFFGALLIAALSYGDHKVTAFLLAGFAALGLLDGWLYLSQSPGAHFAVGLVAAAASLYFFNNRKVAT